MDARGVAVRGRAYPRPRRVRTSRSISIPLRFYPLLPANLVFRGRSSRSRGKIEAGQINRAGSVEETRHTHGGPDYSAAPTTWRPD